MKFVIDRPIKGSYSEWMTYSQTNDFSHIEDKEKVDSYKLRWIDLELNGLIKGWIDDDGVCHRIRKESVDLIEVNTLEELYAITKSNEGKVVFGTNIRYEGVDGWIEIYDDYRE